MSPEKKLPVAASAAARDDNPEWTEADFARAKRGDDIPPHILAAFPKTRGRPTGSTKEAAKRQVTLRLDPDLLDRLRATGAGWQTRVNDILRREVLDKADVQ